MSSAEKQFARRRMDRSVRGESVFNQMREPDGETPCWLVRLEMRQRLDAAIKHAGRVRTTPRIWSVEEGPGGRRYLTVRADTRWRTGHDIPA